MPVHRPCHDPAAMPLGQQLSGSSQRPLQRGKGRL